MFRPNTQHQQPSFFNSDFLMPPKMREQLRQSWAHIFRTAVFARIPEEEFAPLYSDKDSRPNAPVNVLVGGDILKDGFGWTDEELKDHLQFDLLTRYALGLDDLGQAPPTLRTFSNHRRRVREYAAATEVNLYEVVFETITDEQLIALELKTDWQRMDSTQLLSNIAQMSRLALVISVLQQGVKALPAAMRSQWPEEATDYLKQRPRTICYRIKQEEVEDHLRRVGQWLLKAAAELAEQAERGEALALVERVLREQYQIDDGRRVTLRPAQQVSGDSLQSPHDPDATYRQKNDESYRGYVTNLSETCHPENDVQLITSVQTAFNTTDDTTLLDESLQRQTERGIEIEQMVVDGGYTGPDGEKTCADHKVALQPSRLRGGRAAADQMGWDAFSWALTEDGIPQQVTCPQGQTASLQPGRADNRWLARFDAATCAACPLFEQGCRVEPRKRLPPTLNVTTRTIQVARLRQRITGLSKRIRAVVEATVRSFKRPLAASKLPVRGLIRSHMVACNMALMVNVKRLHRHSLEKAQKAKQPRPSLSLAVISRQIWLIWVFFVALRANFRRLRSPGRPAVATISG